MHNLDQRRWQRLAELLEAVTTGVVVPVVLNDEEGGILIIRDKRAFHFFNFKAAVNLDISAADTAESIEGRRNCFRFDAPLEETLKNIAAELLNNTP